MRISCIPPFLALCLTLLSATEASAASRTYMVSGFDRIEASGPYRVIVRTGPGPSARADGDQAAIDRLQVVAGNGRLMIGRSAVGWGGWEEAEGAVTVHVTVPALAGVALHGSGDLNIDRVRSRAFQALMSGSGTLQIGTIETETLRASVSGPGSVEMAGRCESATLTVRGAGSIKAQELRCKDVTASVGGSGSITAHADRDAKIVSAGSGDILLGGTAKCAVTRSGSGDVQCGSRQ